MPTDQMNVESLFTGFEQHQIVNKKQSADPAASISDIFINLAVTICPIHIDCICPREFLTGPKYCIYHYLDECHLL